MAFQCICEKLFTDRWKMFIEYEQRNPLHPQDQQQQQRWVNERRENFMQDARTKCEKFGYKGRHFNLRGEPQGERRQSRSAGPFRHDRSRGFGPRRPDQRPAPQGGAPRGDAPQGNSQVTPS